MLQGFNVVIEVICVGVTLCQGCLEFMATLVCLMILVKKVVLGGAERRHKDFYLRAGSGLPGRDGNTLAPICILAELNTTKYKDD